MMDDNGKGDLPIEFVEIFDLSYPFDVDCRVLGYLINVPINCSFRLASNSR